MRLLVVVLLVTCAAPKPVRVDPYVCASLREVARDAYLNGFVAGFQQDGGFATEKFDYWYGTYQRCIRKP